MSNLANGESERATILILLGGMIEAVSGATGMPEESRIEDRNEATVRTRALLSPHLRETIKHVTDRGNFKNGQIPLGIGGYHILVD
jgi:hypothetical protein